MSASRVRAAGLAAGPALALLTLWLMPEAYVDAAGQTVTLPWTGRVAAAAAVWMAVWWMTEAVSVYATALLPLVLFPVVGGMPMREAASPYAHELIYLFLGGFMLAQALQKWDLHRRLAYLSLLRVGTSPSRIVLAFMLIAAVISMWVTNTATTMMLLPVILSVIALMAERQDDGPATRNFALCLLLGTAYAATIGGVGTIIGTAPNVFVVSFLQAQYDLQISFVGWMLFAVPLVAVFLPLSWWVLTRGVYRLDGRAVEGVADMVAGALREMGPLSRAERRVAVVFFVTVALWMTRPLLQPIGIGEFQPFAGLNDSAIAIAAALSLFVIADGRGRGGRLLDWEYAARIPWGLLILFGGGLSLGAAMDRYGVSGFIGAAAAGLGGLPLVLILLGVVALVIFLTELTSNTATTATLVPILAAIAPAFGLSAWELTVPAAIAASFAFMLPVATPPNAIVFGSGQVSIAQMARAGFWLNLLGMITITAAAMLLIIPMLGP